MSVYVSRIEITECYHEIFYYKTVKVVSDTIFKVLTLLKINSWNAVRTDMKRSYGHENPLRTWKVEQTIEVEDEKKGILLYG
jgi:hypothetical protein